MSPQDMVACDLNNQGCGGGYLVPSVAYLESRGLPSEACVPYTLGSTETTPSCTWGCTAPGESYRLYKCKKGSMKLMQDPTSIKRDIHDNGPVMVALTVYQDFFYYGSGIYTVASDSSDAFAGLHAIKLLGWGVDGTEGEYWIG